MECPQCKTNNPPNYDICFNCGYSLKSTGNEVIPPPAISTPSLKKSYTRGRRSLFNRPGQRNPSAGSSYGLEYRSTSLLVVSHVPFVILGLLSYIPSVGYFIMGERYKGFIALLVFAAICIIGYLGNQLPLLYFMMFCMAALCIYCCVRFVIDYLRKKKLLAINMRMQIAISLLISALFGMLINVVLVLANIGFARIDVNAYEPYLKQGDRLVMRWNVVGNNALKKNDMVIWSNTFAVIIASPFDRFRSTSDGLLVNNILVTGFAQAPLISEHKEHEYELAENEYILGYFYTQQGGPGRRDLEIVKSYAIQGYAIAIYDPPGRRQLL